MRMLGTVLVCASSVILAACDKDKGGSAASVPSVSASANVAMKPPAEGVMAKRPLRGVPKSDKELPTTPVDAFLADMDAQIAELEKSTKAAPKDVSRLHMLSGTLYARAMFRGDLDGIAHSLEVLEKAIALAPTMGDLYLDRADQEQSLGRLDQVKADLAKGQSLGGNADQAAEIAEELAWSTGAYDAAIAAIHAASDKQRTVWTELREAQLHHDLGQELAADRSFESAEDMIHDDSPMTVARLNVQRGVHEVGFGKLESAVVFFREAVRRAPTFPTAREHLAETLRWLGQNDEAQAIEKSLPKPQYEALLAKYPEATYVRAATYYLHEGADPKKAVDLLQKNAAIQPNSDSLVALARAQLAAGDGAGAKASIDKALAMPAVNAALYWNAAKVYVLAREDAKSDDFAQKAKTLNAKIDVLEGPILHPQK